MARSTACCSSGDRATAGEPAVDLLHVDPGVVAPLDRRDHDPRPGRVEQGERSRLVAARVLVGVVADDRGVRDGLVDPAVDPREARRHLVDGAVEVVDPRLQRHRELDQVLPPAADERRAARPGAAGPESSRRSRRPRAPPTPRTTPTTATAAAAFPERCTMPTTEARRSPGRRPVVRDVCLPGHLRHVDRHRGLRRERHLRRGR